MQSRVFDTSAAVPVTDHCDVLVCGGGPAGVVAALGAARRGARVGLIESHGCFGGVWTAGLLGVLLDWNNKRGVMAEIVKQLIDRDMCVRRGEDGLFFQLPRDRQRRADGRSRRRVRRSGGIKPSTAARGGF